MRDMVSYFIDVFTGPLLANQVHGDLRIQPFQYFFANSSNTEQTTTWIQRRFEFVMILTSLSTVFSMQEHEKTYERETFFLPEPRRFNHYEKFIYCERHESHAFERHSGGRHMRSIRP